MVSRCGYERSYSEWENTFVNVMALDDDYYTVEYDIDFEYGTDEMEEVSDEMRWRWMERTCRWRASRYNSSPRMHSVSMTNR